ncbi:MAG: leucine-rich repeat protein [Eubacterium sp.]|nr:leucine-rich repeat protein [Eubacterium sp.]
MAKKTPAKKPRRRLKRSIRRSLSAVLMVTAIAVAAIPVPENVAALDGISPYAAVVPEPDAYPYPDSTDLDSIIDLLPSNVTIQGLTPPSNQNNSAYIIAPVGEEYTLDWQFKYFRVADANNSGSQINIISKYNNSYPLDQGKINPTVISEYNTIEKTFVETFFNGSTTYRVDTPEDVGLGVNLIKKYYADEYDKFVAEYRAAGADPSKLPVPLVKSCSDFVQWKEEVYCICNNMDGYRLVEVNDAERTTSDGVNVTVYIPQKIDMSQIAEGEKVDSRGFQYISDITISGIGDKAFENIQNLYTLDMSQTTNLRYIGKNAFAGCTNLTAVTINYVTLISDGAFKGCNNLTSVEMDNAQYIGTECFYGTGLTSITFPSALSGIGPGAFAECRSLTTIDFSQITQTMNPVRIYPYAFYNAIALQDVDLSGSNMRMDTIGDGAFAVNPAGGTSMTRFRFPSDINQSYDQKDKNVGLGDCVLAGRTQLDTVVMPESFGQSAEAKVPDNLFYNCFNLGCLEFPDNGAYSCSQATYSSDKLFNTVSNPEFYVRGPAYQSDGTEAGPRKATWDAVTRIYPEMGYVPYLYTEGGKEYYEICSEGVYLECIERETGTLIRCTLVEGKTVPNGGTLTIPNQVGGTDVVAIAGTCFSDSNMTKTVRKVVINDKIKTIGNSTFENITVTSGGKQFGKWEKLNEVTIGSAIEELGEKAFYNCGALEDITFKTPTGGYSQTVLKTAALQTNGQKLTIHADIDSDYAPFQYATNPSTYVKNEEHGIRVCYQSRWDSPKSQHMTVMYGEYVPGIYKAEEITPSKSGYVTLLDYPKYNELDAKSGELRTHCIEREDEFYQDYKAEKYDELRREFAIAWDSSGESAYSMTLNREPGGDPLYGPWINPDFCKEWAEWLPKPDATSYHPLTDWLFKPIVAQAADNPTAYFDQTGNRFNFLENYELYKGDINQVPRLSSLGEVMNYKGWNNFESNIIRSVEYIEIPNGVESIDTRSYHERNGDNWRAYLADKSEYWLSSSNSDNDASVVVPGLFSGAIEDYDSSQASDKAEYETEIKGNDRITTVTMPSVKYLPAYAFDNCERLTTVELGDAMELVGALPFRDCKRLVNLTGNERYPAENGILYENLSSEEEENYRIVECLMARGTEGTSVGSSTVIATNDPKIAYVSVIDKNAFEDCDGLSTVDLSEATKLKVIPENCFRDCDNLYRTYLPLSTNDIQDGAFVDVCKTYSVTPSTDKFSVTIKGKEVSISDGAFDPKNGVKIYTNEDTAAHRYATYYAKEGMRVDAPEAGNIYTVVFMDWDGTQIGSTQDVTNGRAVVPDTTELQQPDHRPGYRFTGWLGTHDQEVGEIITADCIFLAQYESDGTTVNGNYIVKFVNGLDGSSIGGGGAEKLGDEWVYYIPTESMPTSFAGAGYDVPREDTYDNYKFLGWYYQGKVWSPTAEITSGTTTVYALYEPKVTSGNTTNTSGNTTNTSRNTTNTSGNATNTSGNGTNTSGSTTSSSNNTTSSSTSSSSTSTSSTTSGSNSTATKYTVTVEGGEGSGSYDAGATVIISAHDAAEGTDFQKWTTESNGVTLASVSMPITTFVMPANNVTVKANYVEKSAATATPLSATGDSSRGTDNGNTRVDITKPGISNKDLATANVNGSTDNFIIKITETDEATRAVSDALTNKYGSLDNILYYAMDISLWDATGTYQLTGDQVAGLSVDITIPIPDALVAYGGNNMAGAVINGNQLENLNENFTTINGVPCIRFTATHFSPYTVYVDTGNLTEGMLDATPKTGDPIHPKWFLSIGLACLSVILFMKKDKVAKVKKA